MGRHYIATGLCKRFVSGSLRHLRHPVLRFAPSTLQRYLADWISWHTFCLAVSADPSDPFPGTLPDWLSVRASKQGLATGPLRALSWMARVAGLPCLQARLQLSIVRAFATATAPSERRESLPLPLSFVIWLERRVADPSAPPSEALFLGFLLIAVWASLRWGDLLWIPPDRLHLQLAHLAVLGTALRTKTTARSMPFGFLITGVSGSPSCNWGMRFLNLLRQALSDTQSRQPGRVIDFLPACLGGSDPRPFILEPCPRRLAVPRLLSLLHRHWRMNRLRHLRNSLCTVRTAARPLSWPGPAKCLWIAPFVESKATTACLAPTTPSSFTDVTISVQCLQAQVINHIRAGFRPLQPLARGTSVPLPDFPVHIPSAPLPTLELNPEQPLLASPAFPPDPSPASVPSPSPAPLDFPHEQDVESPVDSASDASVDSSVSSSDHDEEMEGGSAPRPPSPMPLPASPSARPSTDARVLEEPSPVLFIFNHRTNVVHAVRPTADSDVLAVPDPQNSDAFFRTACGSRASAAQHQTVCRTLPPSASPCLHRACQAAGL